MLHMKLQSQAACMRRLLRVVVGLLCLTSAMSSLPLTAITLLRITTEVPYSTDQHACRAICRGEGYDLAWISDSAENAVLATALQASVHVVILGGNRRMGNQSVYRWTEGPMAAADGGLGTAFFNGKTSAGHPVGVFQDFCVGRPDDFGGVQSQLCINKHGGALCWDDHQAVIADKHINLIYCACRPRWSITDSASAWATATRSTSRTAHSATASASPSTTASPTLRHTPTLRLTLTRSVLSTGTASASAEPTRDHSLTGWSPSPSASSTRNASQSNTVPPTPSGSGSDTVTMQATSSTSKSHPLTPSRSRESTLSLSTSLSTSQSPSDSEEVTLTPSASRSESLFPSNTTEITPTRSASLPNSITTSNSKDITPTPSASRSESLSRSGTKETTPTRSASTSSSAAASATKTTSKCHHVTGENATSVVRRVAYDNTTIQPQSPHSVWGPTPSNASLHSAVTTSLVFAMRKADAIRLAAAGGGVVVLRLLLHANMYVHPEHGNRTVAATTTAVAVVPPWNGTDGIDYIEIRVRPIGNHFLGQAAQLLIPLKVIDGACVDAAAPDLAVTLRMTPTVPLALEVAQIINEQTIPIASSVSPVAAVALTRLSILTELIDCSVDLEEDAGNSLLGVALGPVRGQYMRGAVVGNLVIVAAMTVAVVGLAVVVSLWWRCRYSLPTSLSVGPLCSTLHFPGILYIPVVAVAQPTMTCAVQLMVLEPVTGDRLLGAIGAAVLVVVLVTPLTMAVYQQFCLVLVPRADEDTAKMRRKLATSLEALSCARCRGAADSRDVEDAVPDDILGGAPCEGAGGCEKAVQRRGDASTLVRGVMWAAVATHHWVPAAAAPEGRRWKEKFLVVFADSRTWWFPLVDLWIGIAVGIGGGMTFGEKGVCRAQLGLVMAAYLVAVVLQVVVVTALVPISRAFITAMQLLGFFCCVAIVVVLVEDVNDETPALTAATALMLAIALISALKAFVDVVTFLAVLPSLPGMVQRLLERLLAEAAAMRAMPVVEQASDNDAERDEPAMVEPDATAGLNAYVDVGLSPVEDLDDLLNGLLAYDLEGSDAYNDAGCPDIRNDGGALPDEEETLEVDLDGDCHPVPCVGDDDEDLLVLLGDLQWTASDGIASGQTRVNAPVMHNNELFRLYEEGVDGASVGGGQAVGTDVMTDGSS